MKVSLAVNSIREIGLFRPDEVVWGGSSFSERSLATLGEGRKIAAYCQENRIPLVLECDRLVNDKQIEQVLYELKQFPLAAIKAVRVKDLGLGKLIHKQLGLKLQLRFEMNNGNFLALKGWSDYFNDAIEKIVLGPQMPFEKACEFQQKLPVKLEIPLWMNLLLYTSPRPLFKNLSSNKSWFEGNSEESPHKGFSFISKEQGTLMFHPKQHSWLEFLPEIIKSPIEWGHIDLRGQNSFNDFKICQLLHGKMTTEDFKLNFPNQLLKAFFRTNKSQWNFPKLKNSRLQSRDNKYIGKVLDCRAGERPVVIIEKKGSLDKYTEFEMKLTNGKKKIISTPLWEKVSPEENCSLYFMPKISGLTPQAQIHGIESE